MKLISIIFIGLVGVLAVATVASGNIGAGIGAGLLGVAVAILEKDEVE